MVYTHNNLKLRVFSIAQICLIFITLGLMVSCGRDAKSSTEEPTTAKPSIEKTNYRLVEVNYIPEKKLTPEEANTEETDRPPGFPPIVWNVVSEYRHLYTYSEIGDVRHILKTLKTSPDPPSIDNLEITLIENNDARSWSEYTFERGYTSSKEFEPDNMNFIPTTYYRLARVKDRSKYNDQVTWVPKPPTPAEIVNQTQEILKTSPCVGVSRRDLFGAYSISIANHETQQLDSWPWKEGLDCTVSFLKEVEHPESEGLNILLTNGLPIRLGLLLGSRRELSWLDDHIQLYFPSVIVDTVYDSDGRVKVIAMSGRGKLYFYYSKGRLDYFTYDTELPRSEGQPEYDPEPNEAGLVDSKEDQATIDRMANLGRDSIYYNYSYNGLLVRLDIFTLAHNVAYPLYTGPVTARYEKAPCGNLSLERSKKAIPQPFPLCVSDLVLD